jgi:hypothetical protein
VLQNRVNQVAETRNNAFGGGELYCKHKGEVEHERKDQYRNSKDVVPEPVNNK